jgi:hypothetical protein
MPWKADPLGRRKGSSRMRSIIPVFGIVVAFPLIAVTARKPDPAKSTISIKSHPKGIQMTIVPRDKSGDLFGPGYASEIHFTVSGGSVSAPSDPESDGTYVVVISYPEGDPPTVTVKFGGVNLKKDYVLPRRKRP